MYKIFKEMEIKIDDHISLISDDSKYSRRWKGFEIYNDFFKTITTLNNKGKLNPWLLKYKEELSLLSTPDIPDFIGDKEYHLNEARNSFFYNNLVKDNRVMYWL